MAYITGCQCAQVNRCLSIKGAEDQINKPHAFEISTTESSMYFVADKDKVICCYQFAVCRTSAGASTKQQAQAHIIAQHKLYMNHKRHAVAIGSNMRQVQP